ncbi:uncharacterized protein A1O5_00966 [Cladophialophora psammophila CBS 110553]|uniref:BHLH domain-containing protein n=1 Tax=Cladophialophora psammophila CBS 110553 TaxID=1182543 RepID=W9X8C8_9EURO|nr:uncharacterized protein A1O5_00966 [Cladophialophora psammophila CBS 110553]EXJ76458.1 hypothetical protein A1O5_00966 [Cladophialophora psammophila CBS 110553]
MQTVALAQLQLNGGSESSTDFQTCQSPEEGHPTLGLKGDGGNLSLLPPSSLVDTRKNILRTRVARSSSGRQPKRGRPRKKRNQSAPSEDEAAIQKAKYSHSVIERRYRDNLKGPALSGRVRKSDIMLRAVNYIHQSEVEIRHMDDEIKRLQDQVCIFQKLVNCDDCSPLKDMVLLGIV